MVAPPQDTPNFKTLYIIYLCAPGGGEGHLAASWRGAPGSPKPSCLISHFISSDTSHYRHPLPPPLLPPPGPHPHCSPGGWLGHPSVHGAPSASVVIRLLLLRFTKPLEEGCHRFKGHTLALLLSWVLATLPTVEGILLYHVLIVQSIKEHPKQVCKPTVQQLEVYCL